MADVHLFDYRTLKIVRLNDADSDWPWLRSAFADATDLVWTRNHTERDQRIPVWVPRAHTVARLASAWEAGGDLDDYRDLLVTHGPRPTFYGAIAAKLRRGGTRHLSYLNFTDLPTGPLRLAMAMSFRHVDRFVVYSNMERTLYADYFSLPIERFEMVHWGVQPPVFSASDPRVEPGDYICALGSQARDYTVLCDAMRQVPDCRLVIVATPESMAGARPPPNVSVHQNISLKQAMNILGHSRFMVVPLRGRDVPCGHVTLVSAMHLAKAVISTNSSGVSDYVQPGVTGRVVEAGDVDSLARSIADLSRDSAETERLGAAGCAFAAQYCSEATTIRHLQGYLASLGACSSD